MSSMKTTKLFNYVRASNSNTEYSQRMKILSNSIFGESKKLPTKQSQKVVDMFQRRPYEERKDIIEYYPAHEVISEFMRKLTFYGLYTDEHEEFKKEMARLRALRGKTIVRPFIARKNPHYKGPSK